MKQTNINQNVSSTPPAIILAGGLGTRLRAVSGDLPKPMVPALGKPFLHWLVLSLTRAGFEHFIISTGYKADAIEQYPWVEKFAGRTFAFYREQEQLGTGGALQAVFQAYPTIKEAWVANGDTILENPSPPRSFTTDEAHYTALKREALFDAQPNLHVRGDRVIKIGENGGVFDGGQVYVKRGPFENFKSPPPFSLHAALENSMKQNRVGYTIADGTCYDIGTPERLKRFEDYLQRS